jgi:ubiquinone/menaquinone biosynthesis C-methylase UbiE
MRFLPVTGEYFDLALSLFTSFGYFKATEEDQKVLQEISRILKPGGSYVLDFLNVTFVEEQIVPTEETSVNGQRITILRWVDNPQQRIEKRILIHESEGAVREYRESVRLYTEAELRASLADVDIEVCSTYGNYDGSPLESHSPRLILLGRKHG